MSYPDIFQQPKEKEVLADQARVASRIEGDFAEVGVFRGRSAEIIKNNAPDKKLYLFDTFTGLPDRVLEEDRKHYMEPGDMKVNLFEVKEYLSKYKDIHIYPGEFPKDTSKVIKDKQFAFAHIDVDIYHSTKEAIEFFYPRMNKGGIILVHDYPIHTGVKRAIDEFMKGKTDTTVQSGFRQLIITKQ